MPKKLIKLEVNRQLTGAQSCAMFLLFPDLDAIKEVGVQWAGEHRRAKFEESGDLPPRPGAHYVPIVVDQTVLSKQLLVRTRHLPQLKTMLASFGTGAWIVEEGDAGPELSRVKLAFASVELAWSLAIEWGDFVDREVAKALLADPEFVGDASARVVAMLNRHCRICGCTEINCKGCIERTGKPCHWVAEDLCSACVNDTGQPLAEGKEVARG